MREVQTMTLDEYCAAIKAQGVPHEHAAFRCPMCNTIQSADDLIRAGAGSNFEEVERYLGFSCVGRFTGAGSPRKKPDYSPCNWTLGGLFQMHKLEVVTDDGKKHPRFVPASPSDAQVYMELKAGKSC